VGEDEIDEVIDRINASKGSTEYLLAELFMAVETPDQEEEVRERLTEMVNEIVRGQSFGAIAEQFSQSASATEGGDIGWVERGQLDEETVKALDDLPTNRLTPLIRTASGFYVYLLRDRRTLAAASPEDATVTLAQLLLPTEPGASQDDIAAQTELAQTVRDTVSGCDDFQRIASELNVGPVDPTPGLRIGDLATAIRPAVTNLKVGDVSAPQRTDAGVLLLMVCERKDAVSNLPSREDIADNLTRQRLDLVARRYLRDLRQQAFIDIRT
jgi:peptidyl-prolyl cis-trans isomerase SurA